MKLRMFNENRDMTVFGIFVCIAIAITAAIAIDYLMHFIIVISGSNDCTMFKR